MNHERNVLSTIVALVIGCGLFAYTIWELRKGVMATRAGIEIEKSKSPALFHLFIAMKFLLSFLIIGVGILFLLTM